MLSNKISTKKGLLLAAWTVIIYETFKFQNDYTTNKNILQSNENNLKFDKFTISVNDNKKNDFKFINVKNITNIIKQQIKPSKVPIELSVSERNTCNATRPNFLNLQFDNIYWQTLITINGTIKLFRAFYDDRKKSVIGPSIRIIAMINKLKIINVTTYCQFWIYENQKVIITKAIEYKLIWKSSWGWNRSYLPYLITCPYNFNKFEEIPKGVSLVNHSCDQAKNYLKVLNIRPEKNKGKKPFSVCVKAYNLNNKNIALRLIEWIELVRILGADKIFIYQMYVSGNIRKVFDYYEHYGILEIVKLSYPKCVGKRRSNQVISLNDCFYRNIYLYDYVAIIDIDEMIMPKHQNDMTWMDMLKRIKNNQTKKESYTTYNFRNIYFLNDIQYHDWYSDIPQYLHMLQHINRAINYTRPRYSIKSFHNTELVKTVHNHFPISCFYNKKGKNCNNFEVKTEFGHLSHYRQVCPQPWLPKGMCKYYKNHTIVDTTIWKYKEKLIKQSMKTVNMLKLENCYN